MTIGERIKQLRLSMNMTQEELANIIGYKSRSSIQKIESGERDITQSTIVLFAKALKVTPGQLMGWDQSEDSIEKHDNTIPVEKNRDITIVARHLEEIPSEKREGLINFINSTIDAYMENMGITKKEE